MKLTFKIVQQFIICMKISAGIICFIYFITAAIAQPNYQDRIVYYSEQDNVCVIGYESDMVALTLKLEDYPVIRTNEIGGTHCSHSVIYYRDGIMNGSLVYFNKDLQDMVRVKNELIMEYARGILVDMIARATPSDCMLRGRPCTCKVLGDGIKHHFGNNTPGNPPASISLECKFSDMQ